MTEEEEHKEQVPEKNPVEQLRDEFQQQFTAMKSAYDQQLEELKSQNAELVKMNKDLNRALLRSATTPVSQVEEPKKSQEQLYKERIDAIVAKAYKEVRI